MKEVTLTIRIEQELREEFSRLADKLHMPAAQLVRNLMRSYIAHANTKKEAPFSQENYNRRKEAAEYAAASLALEGLILGEQDQADMQEYILGNVTPEQLIEKYFVELGK